MTTAFWCVLAAALLPYASTAIAKFSGARKLGPKENHNPREWLEELSGVQKRAHWSQLNAFETFPSFAAAVIIAHIAGADQGTAAMLAVAYICFRVAHMICYLADKAQLRTLVFTGGAACTIALFLSPLF